MSDEPSIRLRTHLTKTGENTTGIIIPPQAVQELGAGARPAVVATVNGYRYRTTIGVMMGQSMMPFSAQHREASGIAGGDPIDVEVRLDMEPRLIEIPDDMSQALVAELSSDALFRAQAPSRQRADIENVAGAKTPETRARRIQAIVSRLRAQRDLKRGPAC